MYYIVQMSQNWISHHFIVTYNLGVKKSTNMSTNNICPFFIFYVIIFFNYIFQYMYTPVRAYLHGLDSVTTGFLPFISYCNIDQQLDYIHELFILDHNIYAIPSQKVPATPTLCFLICVNVFFSYTFFKDTGKFSSSLWCVNEILELTCQSVNFSLPFLIELWCVRLLSKLLDEILWAWKIIPTPQIHSPMLNANDHQLNEMLPS